MSEEGFYFICLLTFHLLKVLHDYVYIVVVFVRRLTLPPDPQLFNTVPRGLSYIPHCSM